MLKSIAARSIIRNDIEILKASSKLNIIIFAPPIFHDSMHLAKIGLHRKMNFEFIFGPLIRFAFPRFKKNAVNASLERSAHRNKKACAVIEAEPEIESLIDDLAKDPEIIAELESGEQSPSFNDTEPVQKVVDPKSKFGMSFQREYVVLQIMLDEYNKIKDSLIFRFLPEFYVAFFEIELPLIVLGLRGWRKGDASFFFHSLPLIIAYFSMTGHYKLVNSMLFIQNNVQFWMDNKPEIIEMICMNCDYFNEELIELTHGSTASSGHFNRKNPDEALTDIQRSFVLRLEQRKIDPDKANPGEIFKRAIESDQKKLDETHKKVAEFLRELATTKMSISTMTVEPFDRLIARVISDVSLAIVDYTRSNTQSMFAKEISLCLKGTKFEIFKPAIFYKPLFRKLVASITDDPLEIERVAGPNCLDQDQEYEVYLRMLSFDEKFKLSCRNIPSMFNISSNCDRYPEFHKFPNA